MTETSKERLRRIDRDINDIEREASSALSRVADLMDAIESAHESLCTNHEDFEELTTKSVDLLLQDLGFINGSLSDRIIGALRAAAA